MFSETANVLKLNLPTWPAQVEVRSSGRNSVTMPLAILHGVSKGNCCKVHMELAEHSGWETHVLMNCPEVITNTILRGRNLYVCLDHDCAVHTCTCWHIYGSVLFHKTGPNIRSEPWPDSLIWYHLRGAYLRNRYEKHV